MTRPLICGFLKTRNEILREGNVYRAIANLQKFCDTIVACDDASLDGTREYLQSVVPEDQLILVPLEAQDFRKELIWKQRMLEIVHKIQPHWVFWLDADEELEERGVREIRAFCEAELAKGDDANAAWRFHYSQLWRRTNWARTDDGFDDGWYLKLWRWNSGLSFDTSIGTHRPQAPAQIIQRVYAQDKGIGKVPWEIIHWGNWGKNLTWKIIQYFSAVEGEVLGDPDRHRKFDHGRYRETSFYKPTEAPKPFTVPEVDRIGSFFGRKRGLKDLKDWFTVVIPTFNRAWALPRTLQSLLDQTHQKWVAVVLDDGSTDDTPQIMEEWQDKDPRFFYARYPTHQGAVRMNEIGMDLACEWTEFWTRLGSDDYFLPQKLALDHRALQEVDVCFGPYRVIRPDAAMFVDGKRSTDDAWWKAGELCNTFEHEDESILFKLGHGQTFAASWANIAARTMSLRRLKEFFGNYCDPRLKNMEDYLVNSRLARITPRGMFRWRGLVDTPGAPSFYLGVPPPGNREPILHDAVWRVAPDGASSNQAQTGNEDELTRTIIAEELKRP